MSVGQKKMPIGVDHRRKLTEEQKLVIRVTYKNGGVSQRELAAKYKVSRRLIIFSIYPERLQIQKDRVKEEKRWIKYYDKDKHKLYMRKHRTNLKKEYPNQTIYLRKEPS